MKKKLNISFLFLICTLVIGLGLAAYAISLKEGMHVDEYYSYGLSNYNGNGIHMDVQFNKTYADSAEPFMNYMAVDEAHCFSYANVFEKQAKDVHPPLYYLILHTICSFFPGSFQLWYAGIINLVFFAGVILFTYYIMFRLSNNRVAAMLSAIFCATCGGMIQMNTFLRMYIMLMFFITLLTWLNIKNYEHPSKLFFLAHFVIVILGGLTHYYFWIFLILQGVYFGISLLARKRFTHAIIYFLDTLLAVFCAIAIFPHMLDHIFSGYRGQETLQNLSASSGYLDGLLDFARIINGHLSGGMLGILIVAFLALFFFSLIKKRQLTTSLQLWCMILIPSLLFYMLISKMAVYHYDRYISPIYPLIILLITGMIYYCAAALTQNKTFQYMLLYFVGAICIVTSYFGCDWSYFERNDTSLTTAETFADYDCIVVTSVTDFYTPTIYFEAIKYDSLTFLTTRQLNRYTDTDAFHREPVVVYVMEMVKDDKEILNNMITLNPDYTRYTHFVGDQYFKAYLLQ